jgi:CIC family chloride channel protein
VLLVGGALGALYGHRLEYLHVASPQEAGGFALVGMAAKAAATTHAPLTAAIMVFELSGDYPIALPLLLVTAVATTVSRRLGERSVYHDELRARATAWELTLDGRQMKRTTMS